MRLRNSTKISDKHLEQMIEFVDPGISKDTMVEIKPSRRLPSGYSWFRPKKKIGIWMPSKLHYPYRWNVTAASRLPGVVLSEDENLVFLLAHELRHQWQYRRPPRGEWFPGCTSRSHNTHERDACAYAWRKVRAWRKLQPREVYKEFPSPT